MGVTGADPEGAFIGARRHQFLLQGAPLLRLRSFSGRGEPISSRVDSPHIALSNHIVPIDLIGNYDDPSASLAVCNDVYHSRVTYSTGSIRNHPILDNHEHYRTVNSVVYIWFLAVE